MVYNSVTETENVVVVLDESDHGQRSSVYQHVDDCRRLLAAARTRCRQQQQEVTYRPVYAVMMMMMIIVCPHDNFRTFERRIMKLGG